MKQQLPGPLPGAEGKLSEPQLRIGIAMRRAARHALLYSIVVGWGWLSTASGLSAQRPVQEPVPARLTAILQPNRTQEIRVSRTELPSYPGVSFVAGMLVPPFRLSHGGGRVVAAAVFTQRDTLLVRSVQDLDPVWALRTAEHIQGASEAVQAITELGEATGLFREGQILGSGRDLVRRRIQGAVPDSVVSAIPPPSAHPSSGGWAVELYSFDERGVVFYRFGLSAGKLAATEKVYPLGIMVPVVKKRERH